MLEKMGEFFDARLDIYDEHQRTCIAGAGEFYPLTAKYLPTAPGTTLLDLGCGTGLELEEYFPLCPDARVTGIDLAPGMLGALKKKFPDKALTLIEGDYFQVPVEIGYYDAAVSVESFHHFTYDEKVLLYSRICHALKADGYLIVTDYFSADDAEEQEHRETLLRLRKEENIPDGEFYHYDTPLTAEHEISAMKEGGFRTVEILHTWSTTAIVRAKK